MRGRRASGRPAPRILAAARAFSLALVLALALGAASAGCRSDRDEDLKPPPGFHLPPAQAPGRVPLRAHRVRYLEGFSPVEQNPAMTWRWMGRRGAIELPRAAGAMTLRLVGWVPLELLAGPPRVRLTLGGHLIDSFVQTVTDVRKEYTIDQGLAVGAARLTLILEVSQTGRAPGDARDLGLAINSLDWQSASPTAP